MEGYTVVVSIMIVLLLLFNRDHKKKIKYLDNENNILNQKLKNFEKYPIVVEENNLLKKQNKEIVKSLSDVQKFYQSELNNSSRLMSKISSLNIDLDKKISNITSLKDKIKLLGEKNAELLVKERDNKNIIAGLKKAMTDDAIKNQLELAIKEKDNNIILLEEKIQKYNRFAIIHKNYIEKFDGMILLDNDIEKKKLESKENKQKMKEEYEKITKAISNKKENLDLILRNIQNADNDIKELNINIERLSNLELSLQNDNYKSLTLLDYSFNYRDKIEEILLEQKKLIKDDLAVFININPLNDDDKYAHNCRIRAIKKLIVNYINSETSRIYELITFKNANKLIESYDTTFKKLKNDYFINGTQEILINDTFLSLKKKEIILKFEYEIYKNNVKEQQEQIKAQMREEQREERKIQKDIEKARIEAEKAEQEEIKFASELEKAKETLRSQIIIEQSQKIEAEYNKKSNDMVILIQQLEEDLRKSREIKERNKSMAQQTRAGHVYIISNIGSFGENIYKIGMTRRLEPLDRVRELGDASVPFSFDVHAMIYSKDAPKLEKELHHHFLENRINLVNLKKEFFNVNILDIKNYLINNNIDAEFKLIADSSEFYESTTIRKLSKENNISISSVIKEDFSIIEEEEEEILINT